MIRSQSLQWAVRASFVAATFAGAMPAFAQDNSSRTTLEEVIVTAQRREESLQEIPIAISAFTSEKRDQIGIDSVADMTNFTPGFVYNQGQDRVSMRGIGRYTNQLGADSSVGVYEDGAFETFTVKAGNSSLYVDRIEVLRGPQGTLYGRNSIGGAVNIVSRRPTKDWYSEVRLSYENFNKHIEEGAISGPITENLQFRLVATKYDQSKGYFTNLAGGPSAGNVRDEWVAEGQIQWKITDADDLWLKMFGGEWSNGAGNAGGRTGNQVLVGLDGATLMASPVYPANGAGFTETTNGLVPSLGVGYLAPTRTGANTTGVNPGNSNIWEMYSLYPQQVTLRDYYGAVMHLTHHFDGADLKYIGAAQHYNYFEHLEYGEGFTLATGLRSFQFPTQATVYPDSVLFYQEKHSFNTNEINLQSTGDGALQWVFGLYNFNEFFMQPEEVQLPEQAQLASPLLMSPTGAIVGLAAANPTRAAWHGEGNGGAKTLAAYSQIDWDFAPTWKTTLGVRYSKDWKWGDDIGRYAAFIPSSGVSIDLSQRFLPIGVAYKGATAASYDPTTGYAQRRLEGDWSGVTGTAGVQWTPDKDTNVYFKYSRGFKSGGFNIGQAIAPNPLTEPEHSNDFQLGYKQTFADALQLNIALFYDQYYDAQIPIGVANAAGLVVNRFYNVPESQSDGIEVEASWQATRALQFNLAYGYNHTEVIESGCVINASGDPAGNLIGAQRGNCTVGENLKGNQLPNAPENKLAFNANYTFELPIGSLSLSASYIWRDKQYGSIFNRPYTEAPSWDQTDLRAQLKTLNNRLTVIAFGKNILDDVGYMIGASGVRQRNALGNDVGFIKNYSLMPPRTYGLELQIKF